MAKPRRSMTHSAPEPPEESPFPLSGDVARRVLEGRGASARTAAEHALALDEALREARQRVRPVQQLRGAESQGRILRAALDAFAEKGYAGAKLADIAEAAECSISSIYHRFTDKEGLFWAVQDHCYGRWRAAVDAALAWEAQEDWPATAILARFAAATALGLAENRGLVCAIAERAIHDPQVWAPMSALQAHYREGLGALLKKRAKEIPPARVEPTLDVATQMLFDTLMMACLRGDTGQLNDETWRAGLAQVFVDCFQLEAGGDAPLDKPRAR